MRARSLAPERVARQLRLISILEVAVYFGVASNVKTRPKTTLLNIIPTIIHFQRITTCQYCSNNGGAKFKGELPSVSDPEYRHY